MTEAEAPGEPELDPFAPLLAFAARAAPRLRTCFDRSPIQPIVPIDTRVDKLVDLAALDALAQWKGVARATRPMRDDEYPSALPDQMKECEPQFILRNLDRVEREVDPKEKLPHARVAFRYGIQAIPPGTLGPATYQRPELLVETNLDRVAAHRAAWRQLREEEQWERRFCKEIKDLHKGPMWSYDPDRPPPSQPPAEGGEP